MLPCTSATKKQQSCHWELQEKILSFSSHTVGSCEVQKLLKVQSYLFVMKETNFFFKEFTWIMLYQLIPSYCQMAFKISLNHHCMCTTCACDAGIVIHTPMWMPLVEWICSKVPLWLICYWKRPLTSVLKDSQESHWRLGLDVVAQYKSLKSAHSPHSSLLILIHSYHEVYWHTNGHVNIRRDCFPLC